jgi:hypothetical protein
MNTLEFIQIKCEQLAENKFFIGLMMIMVNIGARFIIEELSDEHRQIAKGDTFRMIVIFCSVFLATRDIVTALIITIIFIIIMREVLKTEDKKINGKDAPKSSSAKQELDKQIDQLKLIKDSL